MMDAKKDSITYRYPVYTYFGQDDAKDKLQVQTAWFLFVKL